MTKYFRKFLTVLELNVDYVSFLGRKRTAWFFVLAAVTSVLGSLNYIALIPLVSRVIDGREAGSLVPLVSELSVPVLGLLVITVFVVKTGLNVVFSHIGGLYGESYLCNLRERLIRGLDRRCHEAGAQPSGDVLHLNNMISRVGSFNWAAFSMLSRLLSAIMLFVSLLLVSARMAAFSMIFVAIWGLILLPVLRLTRRSAEVYNLALKRLQNFLLDEIDGRELIKVFGLAPARGRVLTGLNEGAIRGATFVSDMRAIVGNIQELLIVVTGVLVLSFTRKFQLEIGYLVAYGYVFSKFLGAMNEASNFLNGALESLPATQEILGFVEGEKVPGGGMDSAADFAIRSLRYRGLRCTLGSRRLLEIQELHLQRGDRIWIRGKNGEGKSTLFRALLGLLRCEGSIEVNGDKVLDIGGVSSLYSRFSYIPQTAVVFEGTLVENFLLNSGKRVEDLEKLFSEIGINIEEYFPDWRAFQIKGGTRGLSGGEIQMISCIRALVRDFDVLLVDEFANHLAPRLVLAFDRHLKTLDDKIILCISHSPVAFHNRELTLAAGALT
jgi:ABC-type bacteriocin/lantibiotic exporter with double-glycine peptidase domain